MILSDLCDDPAEEREFLAQAHQSAQRGLQQLDTLLQVARVVHGTDPINIQPLCLARLLQEVQELMDLPARNRNLVLQIELPGPELYVLADPQWLRQILLYLIYTPITLMTAGSIRLSVDAESESRQVRIWIADQRPVSAWSEPLAGGIQQQPTTDPPDAEVTALSPGLTLVIVQMLLAKMQGQLELLATPVQPQSNQNPSLSEAETTGLTQIQCSIPLFSGHPA